MLSGEDQEWLEKNYPELKVNTQGISGIVSFTATYNEATNRFLIIRNGIKDGVGGRRLSGRFNIRIQERREKVFSQLPALYVDDIDPVADRHFNQSGNDHSGCLCSPFQEDEYLKPVFRFRAYFDGLVIPFLYGQEFYSNEGRWLWPEYGHGATGLFESYFLVNDSSKAQECIDKLAKQKGWRQIRYRLTQNNDPDLNMPCVCSSGKRVRRCHMNAFKGLSRLRSDIRIRGIKIPQSYTLKPLKSVTFVTYDNCRPGNL